MKKAVPFALSVVVIICCLAIYALSLRRTEGVNIRARSVSESEIMQGNDSGEAKRTELFNGETVNINTADVSLLTLLPGIGEELGERITAYRQENGNFKSIEEIMQVEGIGERRFAAIREWITTEAPEDENSDG